MTGLHKFNDDTFRAELSPRRLAPDGAGGFKVITPEEAAEREAQYKADFERAVALRQPRPVKSDYCFIDVKAAFAPKVYKLYELTDTGVPAKEKGEDGVIRSVLDENGEIVTRKIFKRVGQCDTLEEAQAEAKRRAPTLINKLFGGKS